VRVLGEVHPRPPSICTAELYTSRRLVNHRGSGYAGAHASRPGLMKT
jgi:hypothetical protein